MKQLLFCCLLLLAGVATGQKYEYKGIQHFPVSEKTGRIAYEGVVEVADFGQEALFNNAKEWFIRTFNNGNEVLHLEDRSEYKMIGKAALSGRATGFGCAGSYTFPFVITVEFKDGRYRYTVGDIDYKSWVDSQGRMIEGTLEKHTQFKGCEKAYDPMYAQLDQDIRQLITSLQASMTAAQSKKEDW